MQRVEVLGTAYLPRRFLSVPSSPRPPPRHFAAGVRSGIGRAPRASRTAGHSGTRIMQVAGRFRSAVNNRKGTVTQRTTLLAHAA
jgi:hypothetical protein